MYEGGIIFFYMYNLPKCINLQKACEEFLLLLRQSTHTSQASGPLFSFDGELLLKIMSNGHRTNHMTRHQNQASRELILANHARFTKIPFTTLVNE